MKIIIDGDICPRACFLFQVILAFFHRYLIANNARNIRMTGGGEMIKMLADWIVSWDDL